MLGGLIKSVGDVLARGGKPPMFDVPPTLPGLQAVTAADLVARAGITVPPAGVQTTSQLFDYKLNTEQDMLGATQLIAHALPEKLALKWAADSARLVEAKLPPGQKEALAAAQAFQARPSLATREAAALAFEKAGPHGPGGLAAKAASLANIPDGPDIPGADKLVPVSVAGAVITAVALSPRTAPKLPDRPPPLKLDLPSADLPKEPLLPVLPRSGSPSAAKNAAA